MPSLKTQLQDDMKTAMREKNASLVSTLRMALAAIQDAEIDQKKREEGLSDQEIIAVLRKEIKKRNDAIGMYEKAGDVERVSHEKNEARVLSRYVPAQATREQIEASVAEILAANAGATQKDFGRLMKEVLAQLGGNADGKMVSEVLKQRLS